MSVGLLVRVGKEFRGILPHLNSQMCCTGAHRASYSTVDLKMGRWSIRMRERIYGERERIGATSIAFSGDGDDAGIRACRDRFSGQPQEDQHSAAGRREPERLPPARYSASHCGG